MLGIHARRVGAVIVTLTILATACGGGGDGEEEANVVLRTQGDITVDDDDVASTTTTTEAAAAGAGASESEGDTDGADDAEAVPADDADDSTDTTTTLPQEEQSAGEALFESVGVFQSCLDAEGYSFIGIPNEEAGPDAPVNQQPYIDALIACAARSQVQERLQEADAAQADLTPEEVESQNRQYVAFRECMIGRGWQIPEPTPDENGLLFPGFAAAGGWQGPAGESIATTDDVGECTSEANVDFGGDS